ncbi:hypothetical protein BCR35DRAFT_331335 [Leucosporidium creatinivorum]|uniref:Dienelactone hydrolase domain-containing protein n=1 Tax=Leucosporidium creatinivorum TaxID=106004 RepID=A0A1Y2FJJ8_9BASI|nr:hypothetical protein BCR35DRAFT_331335 [Leucosporidium creatinivorum]
MHTHLIKHPELLVEPLIAVWKGCSHGFGPRGDISIPEVKAGKEGAFQASVEFLKLHF